MYILPQEGASNFSGFVKCPYISMYAHHILTFTVDMYMLFIHMYITKGDMQFLCFGEPGRLQVSLDKECVLVSDA